MDGNYTGSRSGIVHGIKNTFRALRSRNYRLFYIGQGVSLIGTWMQSIALSWLMFRLTGSPFMLGAVSFTSQIPIFILSPIAGVMGDRFDRRRILIAVQAASMIQAFILAALTLAGVVRPWHLLSLSLLLGIINSFEMPIRQALVNELLDDKRDLPNAIALNSSLFNGSRLLGPAVAGIVVAAAGEGICFLVNGISYIASISAFTAMSLGEKTGTPTRREIIADLREGLNYAVSFTPVRELLVFVSLISIFAFTFPVLLPVFATDILHGNSHTFGFLVSASGAGAFTATLYLASRRSVIGLGRVINIALYALGAGFIIFSLSGMLLLSLASLFIVGFCSIVTIASSNTLIQTVVDERKRGRVMSLYVMAFTGTAPIGGLVVGSVSEFTGAPFTLARSGVCCLVIAVIFSVMLPGVIKTVRPLLCELGITPESECRVVEEYID